MLTTRGWRVRTAVLTTRGWRVRTAVLTTRGWRVRTAVLTTRRWRVRTAVLTVCDLLMFYAQSTGKVTSRRVVPRGPNSIQKSGD